MAQRGRFAVSGPSDSRPRDELVIRSISWLASIAVGVVCVVCDLRMARVSDILTGASILAGFLFGTLVFVFQLRLRITDDQNIPNFGRLRTMIDQSFLRFAEAVVVALVCTALSVIADVTGHADPTGVVTVDKWWTAAIAVAGVRLLTLTPLLVWDLVKAYRVVPG